MSVILKSIILLIVIFKEHYYSDCQFSSDECHSADLFMTVILLNVILAIGILLLQHC